MPKLVASKPLNYWVSATKSDRAYLVIAELEHRFGSYFEQLTRQELHTILTYCTAKSDQGDTWSLVENSDLSQLVCDALDLIDELERNFQIGLAKFLIEAISARVKEVDHA
ncbi:hypothetical protein [Coleofasciculus sp. FACHB-SPT9]|uniref:hypothetical protein n=1 Tax=Cyanophyceae TaxID=3028117 RepID=UPI00168A1025|nr:hypothetical protein [Coleofasciculus sp. FACHB-SPT9]MBD1889334.1 hypothetical protein [Coleofasciculus sp. FACHB-SPT9]